MVLVVVEYRYIIGANVRKSEKKWGGRRSERFFFIAIDYSKMISRETGKIARDISHKISSHEIPCTTPVARHTARSYIGAYVHRYVRT